MNYRYTVVETSLNRAEFRWKWLKFLEYSFLLGSLLCLPVLVGGGAIVLGWITSKAVVTTGLALLAVVGFLAWAIMIISVMAGAPKPGWLAAAVERVDRRLLDRLNTLLFLERRPAEARAKSFALRIARQTQAVLVEKASPSPFPATRALRQLAVFAFLLAATLAFYQRYSPWGRLLAAEEAKATETIRPEKPSDLALPATNSFEQQQNWGEVRITEPGADLKVTKVDVVPLQIEAAANQSLKQVAWYSTINGGKEDPHSLPAPAEPRYAVYQPNVYLDELHLSDWDVMTYYAKANAEKDSSWASDVYFLEVRPFREDILKLPGGEGGKAYQCLNELSALIGRQQRVIRETHQHLQTPQAQAKLQEQDRKKLSEAESDLSDSAQHLYAKMAGEMENKPIGEALDNLAKADKSLEAASKLLGDNAMSEAQGRERGALAELVAARKIFQKAVNENPKAFEDPKEDRPTPVAEPAKKLNEMAEFRNEAKAAEDFVRKAVEQQRNLERRAATARNSYPQLAEQQRQLAQSLEQFEQQHPQPFKGTKAESEQAQRAMNKAAESLEKKSNEARAATQKATDQLSKLEQAMRDRSMEQQLAHAYRLKKMLDDQIRSLGKCANPGENPGNSSGEDAAQRTAGEARETVNQLKRVAEQEPTRDAFGPPLREALSGDKKVDLDAKLTQVQVAPDEASRRQRAGEAMQGLSQVSKAFEASEPKALQAAQKGDALKPDGQESLSLGLAELESLIKQRESNRPVSPQDQAKLGQEALRNLRAGVQSLYGDSERGNQILVQLDQALKTNKDAPVDVELLKKLVTELQHFSVETAERLGKKEDKPEVTNIDPTRLPPAYRGRIQKYFERLSER
jgi:hypothetical protein